MDRLLPRRALREFVEPGARAFVVSQAVVQMLAIRFSAFNFGNSARDRGADVADKAEVELAAAAEIFRPDVDLRDLRVRRQKLLVGKSVPEHQQHVARMHRGIAGREADKAGHADVVGVVELDVLLAAERMHDRALERLGKLHQTVMRAGTTAACRTA